MRFSYHTVYAGLLTCFVMVLTSSCKKKYGPIIEIPELKLKEGQTVRTIMESVSEEGTIAILGSDQAGTGELFVQRVRRFEKTKTPDGFRYNILQNDSATNLRWKNQDSPSETKSELIGRPIVAEKKEKEWEMKLAEGNANPEQQEEIDTFKAYANRKWLPSKPVKIGDSWSFEPKFITRIIHKDLEGSNTTGVMTLAAIKDGNAAVTIKILGGGKSVDAKGSIKKADVKLTGTVVYSLETGLELGLDIKGHITSGVQHTNGEIKAVKLPVVIKDRKKIIK